MVGRMGRFGWRRRSFRVYQRHADFVEAKGGRAGALFSRFFGKMGENSTALGKERLRE